MTYNIERELVGTINENGEAFCFGVGRHQDDLVYLDVVGPTETIKTIRSKLVSNGRLCYLNPPRGRTIYLYPKGSKAYHVHQKKLAYGLVHCILTHQSIREPIYHQKSMTYLIRSTEQQAVARLQQHVHQLVNIPVRDVWQDYLWQAGQDESLVSSCQCRGGVELLAVNLDQQSWTTLIQTGLRDKRISLQ